MTGKIMKAWGARFLRGLGLQLLVTAIVLPLGCVCFLGPLAIAQNGNFDDATTFLILVVPMGGFVTLLVGGSVGAGLWILFRRQRQLDLAFTPLGLTGKMYLLSGRQYHGALFGRQVDAYFYRGPALDLYVSTSVKTRLSVGARDRVGAAIARAFKREPFDPGDPDVSHLSLYTLDESWARELLRDRTARAALLRLTADEGPYELRQFHITPGALQLKLYHTHQSRITFEHVELWVNDLLAIARVAEGLSPPAQMVEATGLERAAQSNRGAFLVPTLAITCGLLAVLMLCAAVPAVVLLLTETTR
jgi:hypothetical protein